MIMYEAHSHIALDGNDYKSMKALHKNAPDISFIRNTFQSYKNNNINFIRDGGDAWGVSIAAKSIAPEYSIDFRSPIFAIHKNGFYGSILGKSYSNINEYALLVNEVKTLGGDFIKIMASGIMDFNEYSRISPCGISRNELKELVHIAKDHGLCVMAHVNGSNEIDNSIEAGVDSIEHGYYMTKDNLSGIKEAGIVWVPTLTPVSNLLNNPDFNHPIISKILDLHKTNILEAFELKINIAMGSDAGSYPVPHAKGSMTEYYLLQNLVNDRDRLNNTLTKSFKILSSKFKHDSC